MKWSVDVTGTDSQCCQAVREAIHGSVEGPDLSRLARLSAKFFAQNIVAFTIDGPHRMRVVASGEIKLTGTSRFNLRVRILA